MKFCSLILTFFLMTTRIADIGQIRDAYRYAKESKENTEAFYELVQKTKYKETPTLLGYYGCALTLKAAFAEKRGDKMSLFRQGKNAIEEAILLAPTDIELRMIRLSVQSNAPRITRYYKDIDTDKDFLLTHVDTIATPQLKEFVSAFITASQVFH